MAQVWASSSGVPVAPPPVSLPNRPMHAHPSLLLSAVLAASPAAAAPVRLMTLEPGHFHAALVQMSMYEQVDPVVHVYAQPGPDLDLHLARIEGFNTRPDNPTQWQTEVHRCDDPLERMLAGKKELHPDVCELADMPDRVLRGARQA